MTAQMRDLAGTVVVVTGAGAGIGASVTSQLLDAGARVVAADLRPGTAANDRLVPCAVDVGDPQACRDAVAAGVAAWGRVDSVVANAGVFFFGGLLDYSAEQAARMVQTNLLGTIWLARAALEHYRTRAGGGDIVITASVAGLGMASGLEAVYGASKAGQLQFAQSLDREVRHEGIRVSVVAPAAVNTGFAAATGRFGDLPFEQGPYLDPDVVADAIVTCLRQPRTLRTALWQLHSLAEEL